MYDNMMPSLDEPQNIHEELMAQELLIHGPMREQAQRDEDQQRSNTSYNDDFDDDSSGSDESEIDTGLIFISVAICIGFMLLKISANA